MEDNNFDVFSAPASEDFQFQPAETPVEQNDAAPVGGAKAFPVKLLALAGAAIVAVVLIIVLLSSFGNSYKTPIKTAEKLLNTKSLSKIIDKAPTLLNGFGESEAKKVLKTIKKSDVYKDNIEDIEEGFDEAIETLQDTLGKNYKISLKIEDKDKMGSKELKEAKNFLKDMAKEADEMLDEIDEEDIADEMGLSEGQVKKMVKQAEKFVKKCKSVKVSKGYELEVTAKITGKELDDPIELDLTICVIKANGKWIPDVSSLGSAINYSDLFEYADLLGGLY